VIKRKTSVILICLLALMVELSAAELTLQVSDEEGRPIPSVEAEMLLYTWGDTHRIALEPAGGTVAIALTPAELQRWWPDLRMPNHFVKGQILLRAPGYVALKSEPFDLFEEGTDLSAPRTVSFPRHEAVALRVDDVRTIDVRLRRPETRFLRLMTTDGTPVVGETVEISMLWSTANHCGAATGADLLAVAKSNDQGLIEVPDGDFEYLFWLRTLRNAHIVGNDESSNVNNWLIMRLTADVTPVVIEYWEPRQLRLTFLLDGEPLAGKELVASRRGCPCGACGMLMAVTDEAGAAQFTPFFKSSNGIYPESSEAFTMDGIWKFDPLLIPLDREVVVHFRSNPMGQEGLWKEIDRFSSTEPPRKTQHPTVVSSRIRKRRSERYNQPGIPPLLERRYMRWTNRENVPTEVPSLADPTHDTVVIATVDEIESFFSLDGSAIYSEYRLKVERVIDGTMTWPLVQGVLTGTRAGGSIKIDPQRRATLKVTGRGFPRLNERYIFFFNDTATTEIYTIHRAYWSKLDTIVPVDPHPEMPYAGMNEAEFLMMILQARQSDG